MDTNNWIWIIAIILLIGGVYMFQKQELFSIADLENKYGAVAKLDSTNPLFAKNSVVAIESSITCPICAGETDIATGAFTEPKTYIDGILLQSCSTPKCEAIYSNWDDIEDLQRLGLTDQIVFQNSILKLNQTKPGAVTEVQPSLLTNLQTSGPISSLLFYQRVQCTRNSYCLDVIRLQQFACDLRDYTCKMPSLLEQPTSTQTSSSTSSTTLSQASGGTVSPGKTSPPMPPEEPKGIPGGGLIVLGILVAGGYYIYSKYKNG